MLLYSERSQHFIKLVKLFKVILFFFIMSKFHKVTVKTVSEEKRLGQDRLGSIMFKPSPIHLCLVIYREVLVKRSSVTTQK